MSTFLLSHGQDRIDAPLCGWMRHMYYVFFMPKQNKLIIIIIIIIMPTPHDFVVRYTIFT